MKAFLHLVTLGALWSCPWHVQAQDSEFDRATLVGLTGVGVVVSLSADEPSPGLTEARLQTAVELRLRRSRIRVLSRDEVLDAPGFPDLYLSVVVIKGFMDGRHVGYSYAYTLQLTQDVIMDRDPSISHVEGVTWQAPLTLGETPRNGFVRIFIESVESSVDQFANAYLAMN